MSNILIDSDLDTHKNSGVIRTAALSFSGTIAAGGEMKRDASLSVANIDYGQILFDNNRQHSGKFKEMSLQEGITLVLETTRSSYITVRMFTEIDGNSIKLNGWIFNPYDETITLQSTTINFRYIPYEATI